MRIHDLGMRQGQRRLRVELGKVEETLAMRLSGLAVSGEPLEGLPLIGDDGKRFQVLYAKVMDLPSDLDESWAFRVSGSILPIRKPE